jgi:signal transduction histidine kinase
MQERVALAGGAFDLHSQPGSGTRVGVRFPIESDR